MNISDTIQLLLACNCDYIVNLNDNDIYISVDNMKCNVLFLGHTIFVPNVTKISGELLKPNLIFCSYIPSIRYQVTNINVTDNLLLVEAFLHLNAKHTTKSSTVAL